MCGTRTRRWSGRANECLPSHVSGDDDGDDVGVGVDFELRAHSC